MRPLRPAIHALAEAVRDPEFVVRRIDHPDAAHEIVLHWRRASPMRDDFLRLADDLVAVKGEIRARRDERLR